MRKGILRILLTVFMLVGLIPMSALAAENQEQQTTVHKHCICGSTTCGFENGHNQDQEWTACTAWNNFQKIDGYVYLKEDVSVSIYGRKTLSDGAVCLNGKVIKSNEDENIYAFGVNYQDYGIITDCDLDTEHKFSVNNDGLWVLDEDNGTQTVKGGVITGFKNSALHGAENAKLSMYGGNLIGNTSSSTSGGAVYYGQNNSPFEFNMYGGTIQGNGGGRAIYTPHCTVNVYSGIIANNYSGGIDCKDFYMGDGAIENNTGAGGVTVGNICTLEGNISIGGNTITISGVTTNRNLWLNNAYNHNYQYTVHDVVKIGPKGLENTNPIGVGRFSSYNSTDISLIQLSTVDYSDKFVSDNPNYKVFSTLNNGQYNLILKPLVKSAVVFESPANGTVELSVGGNSIVNGNEIESGEIVTINATPTTGYVVDTITVYKTDAPNTKVSVTDNTFTMPDYAVTVVVTFKVIEYPVWVGGVQFTYVNRVIDSEDNVEGHTGGSATLTIGDTDAEPVYTVTLNNFKYVGDGAMTITDRWNYSHWAVVSAKDADLNVVLMGDNNISCTAGYSYSYGHGLYTSNGVLTVTSEDKNNNKLVVGGETCGILSSYVGVGDYGIVIKNANVTAYGRHVGGIVTGAPVQDKGIGICIENSVVNADEIETFYGGKVDIKETILNTQDIDGSILTIDKSTVTSNYAGSIEGNTAITNSTIICNGVVYALKWDDQIRDYVTCSITITDSNVTAETTDNDETAFLGDVIIKGSSIVTATGATSAFSSVPTLEGEVKVYAGDAAPGMLVENPTADTYISKYVKIEPKPAPIPTPTPSSKPSSKPKEEAEQEEPTLVETAVAPTVTPAAETEVQPAKKPVTTVLAKEPEVEVTGEVVVKDKEGLLGFGGMLEHTADQLTDILISETERQLLDEGTDIFIYLENTEITDAVAEEEKELIETAVESLDNAQIGAYIDINLYKQIGDKDAEKITNTDKPLTITLPIPQELINTNENVQRTYFMVRVHDGKAEIIDSIHDEPEQTLTFSTDRFSTYAIGYSDVVNEVVTEAEPAPEAQQEAFPWWIIIVGVAATTAIVAFGIYNRKKED